MTTNTNVRLKNVPEAFKHIKSHGTLTKLKDGTKSPAGGHVQGICASGGCYVLTNSQEDNHTEGYFQVFHKNDDAPEDLQKRIRTVSTDVSDRGHAGGCQEIGSYMVAGIETVDPFENGGVWLYSLANLKEQGPRKLRNLVKGSKGCGGAGITEFHHDGKTHWLLAAMDNGDLDFYVSNGKPLEDSGCEFSKSFAARLHDRDDSSSTVNLITDVEGQIYLVAFVYRDPEDHLVLYKVDRGARSITRLDDRHMFTEHGDLPSEAGVHFRWGAGINIRDDKSFDVLATQKRFITEHSLFAINRFKGS